MRTYYQYQLIVLALGMAYSANAQIDGSSIRLPKLMMHQADKSLMEQAIEEAVYLVRQEYQLKSPDGKIINRGDSAYFGKAYRIGILADRQLWIPASLRKPWAGDPNFASYRGTHAPFCVALKIKPLNQPVAYRTFTALTLDTSQAITYFSPGNNGLAMDDTLPAQGSLLVYYVEREDSPEESPVKSSLIPLDALVWDAAGTAEIQDIQFNNRHILGGALFSEEIQIGTIEIKLVALYIEMDDHWVLKAPSPLTTQQTDAKR